MPMDTSPLTIRDARAPLRNDEYGVARVGNSQVLLDIVIREYQRGLRPEEIAQAYSTLTTLDVEGVISYYLQHRDEVDRYLAARREQAERQRQEIEAAQPDRADLRAKLLTRKAQMEQSHASARQ